MSDVTVVKNAYDAFARGRHHIRGKGGEADLHFAMFWTVRDGKVVSFHEVQDTARTLSAIG